MPLERSARVPLRYQLAEHLRREMGEGRLAPSQQLPTEAALMEAHRVSRSTVREAIRELVIEGRVVIQRGRGTFVAEPRIEPELTSLTGFVEDMLSLGLHPTARVLAVRQGKASGLVAERLGLAKDDPVIRVERIRLANDQPISFDLTFLPLAVGEKVVMEDLRLYPIFSLLEDQADTPLEGAEYFLEARSADRRTARALEVPAGAPLLVIERTVYSTGHRPVDYEQLYYRGDRFRYLVRLNRKRPDFRLWELKNYLELMDARAPAGSPPPTGRRPHVPG